MTTAEKYDLSRLSLTDATTAMADGTLTSVEYHRALLERINLTETLTQAWAYLHPHHVLAAAQRADEMRATGAQVGPLHGVGVGIKDIIATEALPTQMGSSIYSGAHPTTDADCVARIRQAGGFVLGKTVTTEFAFMQPGKTRNPWNSAHTPGGSSSGSAAAVALGHTSSALGTQTNGSIIRPAAYCGVVGFKPTRDAISLAGVHLFSPSFDTIGVFSRTVNDASLLVRSMSDTVAAPLLSDSSVRAPRLGWLTDLPWTSMSDEQSAAMAQACNVFTAEGAEPVKIRLPQGFDAVPRVHRTIMLAEAAREFERLQKQARTKLSDKLNAALDEGRAISAAELQSARLKREQLIVVAIGWLREFDAVITAPASGPAPADLTQTGDPSFCTLWSLLGFPAVNLPIALARNGLPLGMQLAAVADADAGLLAAATWCERHLHFANEPAVGSQPAIVTR